MIETNWRGPSHRPSGYNVAGTTATTTEHALMHRKRLMMDQWKILLVRDRER